MQTDGELRRGSGGREVTALHAELALIDIRVPDTERREAHFGSGTHTAVCMFQLQRGLEPTGIVDPSTAESIRSEVDQKTYVITGTVRSPDRAGIGGLRVVIVDRQVDGSVALAGTHTDAVGRYEAHFSARRLAECHKTRPDLQTSSMRWGVWHADEHGTVTGTSTASSPAGGYEFHSIIFGPIFGDRRTPTPSR